MSVELSSNNIKQLGGDSIDEIYPHDWAARLDLAKLNSQYFAKDDVFSRGTKVHNFCIEQLIVPIDGRMEAIEKANGSIFGAHFASRQTLQNINQVLFWPGMKK